ncbi:MAG: HlyD family secretion protein [Luteimonas sp.]
MNARAPALLVALLAAAWLAGCREDAPQALGTLEYDRIAVPAPVAERIVAIDVREGERVAAGQALLQLETTRTAAATAAAQAEAQRQQAALAELQAGPRAERIAQARAQLAAAQAQARDAQAYYARLQPLGAQKLVAAADVDRARAAAGNAQAQVRAAQAALDELVHGTRAEEVAQGESAARAAQAQATAQQATLEKLSLVAPRAGIVDSLPYRLGDQAPVGAPLAILLAGDAPYARVYVPETLRGRIGIGTPARVFVEGMPVEGRAAALQGKVRAIRSEPVFTPYYALAGKDAARLSYLAEIALPAAEAGKLAAGLPLRAEFGP